MEYVYCEHITKIHDDPYALSPEDYFNYRFLLGPQRMLVLCSRCYAAMAYEMVAQFYRKTASSEHISLNPYFNRRR